jgi:hypothetical protein
MKSTPVTLSFVGLFFSLVAWGQEATEPFLAWKADRAVKEGKSMRSEGRVSGNGGFRIQGTDRAVSYKIRATWMTPDVIRATARQLQIRNRLSNAETMALVSEASAAADTVVMVEIDPVEGSGVVPLDWTAFLQPKGLKEGVPGGVQGTNMPQLRNVKALAGVMQRDYAYEVFWLAFPLVDKGVKVLADDVREAELAVTIYGRTGKVSWDIPQSIRSKSETP